MKQSRHCAFFLFAILFLSVFLNPRAALSSDDPVGDGVSWLYEQKDAANGSWGLDAVRETAMVIDALRELGEAESEYATGLSFLAGQSPLATDHLCRKIIALSGSAFFNDADVASLKSSQNPDGGFGFAPGWPSSVPDSLLALHALARVGVTDQEVIGRLLLFITDNQHDDGGFGFAAEEGNLALTACSVEVLSLFQPRYAGLAAHIADAIGFLGRFGLSDGSFVSPDASGVVTTALAARAFLAGADNAPVLLGARRYLLDAQLGNGSWEDDPVATALALVALAGSSREFENPDNGTIDPGEARPNLAVYGNDIGILPADPADGEFVTATVTVRNTGTAPAADVQVGFYAASPPDGAEAFAVKSAGAIEPGGFALVSCTWRVQRRTGRERLYVVADPANLVSNESSTADNMASCGFTVGTAADLSIAPEDISFDNPAPLAGEACTVTAVVRNIGESDAGPVRVAFYDAGCDDPAGPLLAESVYSDIVGGGSAAAQGLIRLDGGPHTICVKAVPVNDMAEQRTDNNMAGAALAVRPVEYRGFDLSVSAGAIAVSPQHPRAGEPVTITVAVANSGDQDAYAVRVRLFDGDPEAGRQLADHEFPAVRCGGRQSLIVEAGGLTAGAHDLYAVVDPVAGEISTANNAARRSLTVQPADSILDLAVAADAIVFEPLEPLMGDMVTIRCGVHNAGTVGLENVKVRLYDGPPEAGRRLLDDYPEFLLSVISPGATGWITVHKETADWGGRHDIWVVADPDNETGDMDRLNNRAHRELVVAGSEGVDLTVGADDIAFDPAAPAAGDPVTVRCRVANRGSAASPPCTALISVGDAAPVERELAALAPGEAVTIALPFATAGLAGSCAVRVEVDPGNTTGDVNLQNNTAVRELYVGAADLAVFSDDITFEPVRPLLGDDVAISCTIRNIGARAAEGCAYTVYNGSPDEGGTVIQSGELPQIPSGDAYAFSVSWQPSAAQSYRIYVQVAGCADANGANNRARRTLAVSTEADLAVDTASIRVSPQSPRAGDFITVQAHIVNLGGTAAEDFAVAFFDGAAMIGQPVQISRLLPDGGRQPVEKSFTLSPGAHSISIVADYGASVQDSDASNNTDDVPLTVEALADLEVRSGEMDVSPAAPQSGDDLIVSALVRNHGVESYAGVGVAFYDGDPEAGGLLVAEQTVDIPAVEPQSGLADTAVRVRATCAAISGGMHELWVVVDPQAGEAEAGNNRACRVVTVPSPDQPDFGISRGGLTWSPAYPLAGEPVAIAAQVANYGQPVAETVSVRFYEGLPGSASARLLGGAALDSGTGRAGIVAVFAEGEHDIYAVIDAGAPDANPNNNMAGATIPVGARDGFYDDCGNPDLEPHLVAGRGSDAAISGADPANAPAALTASTHAEAVQYAYTGLDPNASYQVVVNYLQEPGGGRVQRLLAGDVEVHAPLALPENTAQYTVCTLPARTYQDGAVTLSFEKITGPDVLVSEIYVLKKEGKREKAVSRGANWLAEHQHANGGWQSYEFANQNAITLYALIVTGNKSRPEYGMLKKHILEMQATNGSWNNTVASTAYSIIALVADNDPGGAGAVSNAVAWLKRTQNNDEGGGDWGGSVHATSLALIALIQAGVDIDSDCVQDGIGWIKNTRNTDGFWGDKIGEASKVTIMGYPAIALKLADSESDPAYATMIAQAIAYFKNHMRGDRTIDICSYMEMLHATQGSPSEMYTMRIRLLGRQITSGEFRGAWVMGDDPVASASFPDAVITAKAIIALWYAGERGPAVQHGIQYLAGLIAATGQVTETLEYGMHSAIASVALQKANPQGFLTQKEKVIKRFIDSQLDEGSWYGNGLLPDEWDGDIYTVPQILYALKIVDIDVEGKNDAINEAVTYLGDKKFSNAGWPVAVGNNLPSHIGTTAWCILALEEAGQNTHTPAVSWLIRAIENQANVYFYYTSLAAVALSSVGYSNNASDIATTLRNLQHPDGGWGSPDSCATDTAWVLLALHATGDSGIEAVKGAEWLLSHQNADGGWGVLPGIPESCTYQTAAATWALAVSQRFSAVDLELLFNKPWYYPGDRVKMAVNILRNDAGPLTVAGALQEYGGVADEDIPFNGNSSVVTGFHDLSSSHPPGTDTVSITAAADSGFGAVSGSFIVKNGEGVRPDIAVLPENIEVIPAAPYAGESVSITATITNRALRDAVNVQVSCYDGHPDAGGILIGTAVIDRVCGLEGQAAAFTAKFSKGPHEIYVAASSDPSVGDADSTNNLAHVLVSVDAVPAAADLVVSPEDITLSPLAPVEGQSVSIHATVHNSGRLASEPAVVRFTDSAAGFEQTVELPAIAEGGSADVHAAWPSPGNPGRNYLHVQVNPAGPLQVEECRYDNNEAIVAVDVAEPELPDLRIGDGDIAFAPAEPLEADPVAISATVTNWGTPAGGFSVRFYDGAVDDGREIGDAFVYETLFFGQSATVTAAWDEPDKAAGPHTIFAVADPAGATDEADETRFDNTASAELAVGSGGLSVEIIPDAENYGAYEDMVLHTAIESLDGGSPPVVLDVVIKDSAGTVVAAVVTGQLLAVPASQSITWNTGALRAGQYAVWALVRESGGSGAVRAVARSPFQVVADRAIAATVTAQRPQYRAYEQVRIPAVVKSLSPNSSFENLTAVLRLRDPQGQEIFSREQRIGILPPLQNFAWDNAWNTADHAAGTYRLLVSVKEGQAVLAADNATFAILPGALDAHCLQGAVMVSPAAAHAGSAVDVSWQVRNSGNADPGAVALAFEVVRVDGQQTGQGFASACSLAAGQECSGEQVFEIGGLLPGEYVLVMTAQAGDFQQVLSHASLILHNQCPEAAAAVAGPAPYIGGTVVLDATGSHDPDNDTLSYRWTAVAPANDLPELASPNAAQCSFVPNSHDVYEFDLVVSDGFCESAPQRVVVAIVNRRPVAVIHSDQEQYHVDDVVTLDAGASTDPDGDAIENWEWILTKPDQSVQQLDPAPSVSFALTARGTWQVKLRVYDGIAWSDSCELTLTTKNRCPVADAGADQTAQVGQTVQLAGSGADDDGDELTYRWVLTAPAGSGAALDGPHSPAPSFTPDMPGTYTAVLTVDDGACESEEDSVTISVETGGVTVPDCNDLPVPEAPCAMKTDYGPGSATGSSVKVYSYSDYLQYEADNYGFKNGKYKNLEIAGNMTMPAGDLVMHSPARIEVGKEVSLKAPAGAICLDGRLGVATELVYLEAGQVALMSQQGDVSLGRGARIEAGGLFVSAGGSAGLEKQVSAEINGPVTMVSTGGDASRDVAVKEGAVVMADSLLMRGPGSVEVREGAALHVFGPMRMITTGGGADSKVRVKYGAAVHADSLCITGPEEVSVGPASLIDAATFTAVSTGDRPASRASIKPATIVRAVDMNLCGARAWLYPLSLLMIRSTLYINADLPGGCSVKGWYQAGAPEGNCLE